MLKKVAPKPTVSLATHIGWYHVTSKTYSRYRCIGTMLKLDPDLKVVYVHLDRKRHEVGIRSTKLSAKGVLAFHFNAAWKLETVTYELIKHKA